MHRRPYILAQLMMIFLCACRPTDQNCGTTSLCMKTNDFQHTICTLKSSSKERIRPDGSILKVHVNSKVCYPCRYVVADSKICYAKRFTGQSEKVESLVRQMEKLPVSGPW